MNYEFEIPLCGEQQVAVIISQSIKYSIINKFLGVKMNSILECWLFHKNWHSLLEKCLLIQYLVILIGRFYCQLFPLILGNSCNLMQSYLYSTLCTQDSVQETMQLQKERKQAIFILNP